MKPFFMIHPVRKNPSCGFTLIELMIVIAIIGIVSGITISGLFNPENRIKKAAIELMGDMHQTRMAAIKNNTNHAIIFTPGNNEYQICDDPGPDGLWAGPGTESDDNNIIHTVSFTGYGAGIQYGAAAGVLKVPDDSALPANGVSYTNTALIITPQGTSNPGWIYLTYSDISYAVGTLTTGIIRILRWDGGAWK